MNFDSRSFLTEKLKLSPLAGGQDQTWPGIFLPLFYPPSPASFNFMGGAPSPQCADRLPDSRDKTNILDLYDQFVRVCLLKPCA